MQPAWPPSEASRPVFHALCRLPVGNNWGWHVLGKHVVFELAQLTELRLLKPPPFTFADADWIDELDRYRAEQLLPGPAERRSLTGDRWRLSGPVIQPAASGELMPYVREIEPPYDVGFAVFEESALTSASVEYGKRTFRRMAAGSTYCAEVLRAARFRQRHDGVARRGHERFSPSVAAAGVSSR